MVSSSAVVMTLDAGQPGSSHPTLSEMGDIRQHFLVDEHGHMHYFTQ